ncbi:unnamed protein product (macronuclear) [Paramecium tetraurelia]|uniref:HSF-type DNA-binding domain-containing protein n=1 Tax=Paramecium tetraurelia TaxID=5888 RepID=A0DFJ2_PARTE|nr:uncharacterized protein GSPATT00016622001 [Paramecium tetraurelia]CAK81809.1 unnamed protein product [Paramecium tetraurelia]|eukprot:XP_001449206.1 hypothetical protein (macronuclear) [Paramecium tetraurelia strain d4-2]
MACKFLKIPIKILMSNQDINELPALKVNVPSFLMKTYEILENPSLSHIITWNQEGNAFIVLNTHELASKVLANYFKHQKLPQLLEVLYSVIIDNLTCTALKKAKTIMDKVSSGTNGLEEDLKLCFNTFVGETKKILRIKQR